MLKTLNRAVTRLKPVLRGGSAKFNLNAIAWAWFAVVLRHLGVQIVVFVHFRGCDELENLLTGSQRKQAHLVVLHS